MRISEGFGKPENDGKVGDDIPSRTPPLALSKYYEVVGTTLWWFDFNIFKSFCFP